jgi:hypothetical protein
MAATMPARGSEGPGGGPAALAEYYRSPAVRARIAEYCGGRPDDLASLSAVSLAGYGGPGRLMERDGGPVAVPLAEWARLLAEGTDVCRSLADRAGTLLLLDVDYVNHDDPGEPYRDPARTFGRLEPVYRATVQAFEAHGIHPLALMTGRGYHFVVKALKGTPLHTALVSVGALGPSLRARHEALAAGASDFPVESGRAHEGAGRLLESFAHEVVRAARARLEVPITLLDMGPPGGGPFVCLDLTAYADPLLTRSTRCAFAGNQKALVQDLGGPGFVLTLPRRQEPLEELLRARADPGRAQEMAAAADTAIPAALGGTEWISAYRSSALARFHHDFDAGPEVERQAWPATYDGLDLGTLPACAALPLQHPNPALLTPGWLRTVALALWAHGWHPRSIAALVRSKYLRPQGWGTYWQRYDAESRARFYVRVSCGALAAGLEQRGDFTCASQRARGLCPGIGCGFDLLGAWDAPRPPWGGAS